MLSLLEETRKHQESFRDLKSVEEIIAMCKDLENKESCMQNIVGNLDKMKLDSYIKYGIVAKARNITINKLHC